MDTEILVVKIGGNIVDEEAKLAAFLKDFAAIKTPKILIHGGGSIATKLSDKLHVPTEMVDGRRITTKENLDVVTMAYAGLINKKISAALQGLECNAMGLAGCDANTISAHKREITPIDFGWVGDINKVNSKTIQMFLDNNITPVFSAISHDSKGQLLNTNADTISAEIAIAMSENYKTTLVYCFDKQGVLEDLNNEDSVVKNLNFNTYELLKANGNINKGMLPKLENSFHALNNKVSCVKIGDAHLLRDLHALHTNIRLL